MQVSADLYESLDAAIAADGADPPRRGRFLCSAPLISESCFPGAAPPVDSPDGRALRLSPLGVAAAAAAEELAGRRLVARSSLSHLAQQWLVVDRRSTRGKAGYLKAGARSSRAAISEGGSPPCSGGRTAGR